MLRLGIKQLSQGPGFGPQDLQAAGQVCPRLNFLLIGRGQYSFPDVMRPFTLWADGWLTFEKTES